MLGLATHEINFYVLNEALLKCETCGLTSHSHYKDLLCPRYLVK